MLERKELKEQREFLCIVPIAVACVADTLYNPKLTESIYSKTLPDVKDRERRFRNYSKNDKNGSRYATYVDPISRVNFKIVGEKAKAINEEEREILLKRVNELKADDVEIPEDIEIWELASSYEACLKAEKEAQGNPKEIRKIPLALKKKRATSVSPDKVPSVDEERPAIIAELKALDVSHHHKTSTENLKKLLEGAKAKRAENPTRRVS